MSTPRRVAPWMARLLFAGTCLALPPVWLPGVPVGPRLILAGLVIAVGLALEQVLARLEPARAAGSLGGLFVGAGAGAALLALVPTGPGARGLAPFLVVVLAFVGAVSGGRLGDVLAARSSPTPTRSAAPKVLDSSAIIDGRIADIVSAGFLDGSLVVPSFVLREIQGIADSSDARVRARGRRGLDVLERLRDDPDGKIEFPRISLPDGAEVDDELVRLAQRLDGALVTTDFNLNKIAGLHDVAVLNVNDLARAVRSSWSAGDRVDVDIVREGKEPGQGVAYDVDGAMIVVEDGRDRIGGSVTVEITRVLQTPAGRMYFGRPAPPAQAAEPDQNG